MYGGFDFSTYSQSSKRYSYTSCAAQIIAQPNELMVGCIMIIYKVNHQSCEKGNLKKGSM